jgi:hypothetical protein
VRAAAANAVAQDVPLQRDADVLVAQAATTPPALYRNRGIDGLSVAS